MSPSEPRVPIARPPLDAAFLAQAATRSGLAARRAQELASACARLDARVQAVRDSKGTDASELGALRGSVEAIRACTRLSDRALNEALESADLVLDAAAQAGGST